MRKKKWQRGRARTKKKGSKYDENKGKKMDQKWDKNKEKSMNVR